MDLDQKAKAIVDLVGGVDNINSVTHCITRLRFKLKDRSLAKDDEIKKVDGVLGLLDAGGQLQIVVGMTVGKYYEAVLENFPMISAGGEVPMDEGQDPAKENMSVMDRITDFATALFIPTVSLLAACGTLQGILTLLTTFAGLSTESGTYLVLNAIGNVIFYYYPVFLAFSAAKRFHGKPFFSVAVALVMLHPTIVAAVDAGTSYTFLGIPMLLMNYTSSVLPILFASYFACKVEQLARKIVPDVVKVIFVPLLTLLISVPVAILIIGPIMTVVMNAITGSAFFLVEKAPVVAGVLVGALWNVLVFLGVSKAFVAVFAFDLGTYGYDSLVPVAMTVCSLAQGGAVLAYALRSRNTEIKQVGVAAFVATLFGITEPAMFGVSIPAKKPFVFALIGSAVGGLITVLFGCKGYSIAAGLLGIPCMIGPSGIDGGFYAGVIGTVVAFVVAFVLTFMLVDPNKAEDQLAVEGTDMI